MMDKSRAISNRFVEKHDDRIVEKIASGIAQAVGHQFIDGASKASAGHAIDLFQMKSRERIANGDRENRDTGMDRRDNVAFV